MSCGSSASCSPTSSSRWDGFRPGFNHTDHRVIGRVVRDALFPAAHDPHYYPETSARDGIGPWRTAELLLAATDDADFHVDIGPYLEQKVDAILCHTSQIDGRTRDEMLKGWRGAREAATSSARSRPDTTSRSRSSV